MTMNELITELRNVIGDNNIEEPNITDSELTTILKSAASGYSRIKSIVKRVEIPYDKNEDIYDLPLDSYKVKSITLKEHNLNLNFINNMNQVILEDLPDVDLGTLKITYIQYFTPEEIDEREIDLYFIYAESLCYKHMASKSADWIKFSTGEKMVDESLVSKKYLELYEQTQKDFKRRVIKAYGRRANNVLVNLDYEFPYPTKGETP
jgi:hypothetical protein